MEKKRPGQEVGVNVVPKIDEAQLESIVGAKQYAMMGLFVASPKKLNVILDKRDGE